MHQVAVGLAPGDVLSPEQMERAWKDRERLYLKDSPRCWRCNRVLAVEVTRPWRNRCGRCKTENAIRA